MSHFPLQMLMNAQMIYPMTVMRMPIATTPLEVILVLVSMDTLVMDSLAVSSSSSRLSITCGNIEIPFLQIALMAT